MRWLPLALLPAVSANVEKVIFKAPAAITISQTQPNFEALCLDTLSPSSSVLNLALPVAFPTEQSPRGEESWYLVRGLAAGQRHEVRVCWAATPTEFWLDTFTLQETFGTPELITALADYSEAKATAAQSDCGSHGDTDTADALSLAFLRIQAAADFFSTNRTLMRRPPDVQVDIILDPYLLSILPRSLGPTVLYLVVVAVGSWLLSGYIWSFLSHIGPSTKRHSD